MILDPAAMQTPVEAPTQDIKPPNPDVVSLSKNLAEDLDEDTNKVEFMMMRQRS